MNPIAWVIVGCEIAFWIVIVLGLSARYIMRLPRLGMALLIMTPVIDLILLAVTGWDLYHGGTGTMAHGIAAVYIGVSVAYGKRMIAWADERFRYYIAKEGEKPAKLYGYAYSVHYLKGWGLHVVAYAIGCGVLLALVYMVQDAARTEALSGIIRIWSVVVGIDLVISISYFIWPRKAPDRSARG